jgi:hypothetical protein
MLSLRHSIFIAAALAVAAPCLAQSRGSAGTSDAAPRTKDAGPRQESAQEPGGTLPIEPRHGLLGAPGAAPDADGPSRLGREAPTTAAPSYGEAPAPIGGALGRTMSRTWQSGDRVRSPSSADVRLARLQEAPDIERPADDRQGEARRGGGGESAQKASGGGDKASASANPPKAQQKAQGRKAR